ncbi:EF2563 family selenium-dependent molybdenum hydroxylase system protein [Roseburia sp. MUC/MUC-530-WT-4D]|uniref:EF2563 family selenium-dependent molybdenum hydroxylase system protein n=1 Tax=Roseburia porci TaxID=2605790 RepID=A0A6L5YSH1_9FIRM|nr:selenium-dependent molybdenum cofactor biosynthesis protein YqeB [Roseburia porci]MDD6742061.1 selenium-dependent molybdenum cofactor biosynthesis protein YqeB [Roseburia porci]MST75117.1 EF2563 family selenium-dependent molybdenum hydroxylase system protein [Roseburia porci]
MKDHYTIIVRGGGDLATGSIYYLWKSGFRVLVLEAEHPAAIRRQVSLSEAVYQKETIVEQMKAVRVESLEQIQEVWSAGNVPVLVDPNGESIQKLQPDVLIDAIIAKKNLGTNRAMAPLTIALGPGFFAGQDVDYVIETKRGHNLGRIITDGTAVPNTGIPGNIGGYAKERVIHARADGILHNVAHIGDVVEQGQEIAYITSDENDKDNVSAEKPAERYMVQATIPGIVRGLIRDGYPVTRGFKIADIDPRQEELKNCFTISDKARCIAGSVLQLVCQDFFRHLEE